MNQRFFIAIAIILLIFNLSIIATPANTFSTSQNKEYKLAINWQPAFCETRSYLPECKNQDTTSFEATNFTLHGLWSESIYCGVSPQIVSIDRANKWSDLPAINLSANLFKELKIKMPGVASNLHLHEWYKHGTCYSKTSEEYYLESLALLDRINQSKVRKFFQDNLGRSISSQSIINHVERDFGRNAGTKITFKCQQDNRPTNRNMITELQLNLKGEINSNTSIAELFKQSETVSIGCLIGEIDRVGLD